MAKAVAIYEGGYANLAATHLEQATDISGNMYILAYNGETLVGVFTAAEMKEIHIADEGNKDEKKG